MEYVCWAIFSIICTIGFSVAFHYDLGDGPYSKTRGFFSTSVAFPAKKG